MLFYNTSPHFRIRQAVGTKKFFGPANSRSQNVGIFCDKSRNLGKLFCLNFTTNNTVVKQINLFWVPAENQPETRVNRVSNSRVTNWFIRGNKLTTTLPSRNGLENRIFGIRGYLKHSLILLCQLNGPCRT